MLKLTPTQSTILNRASQRENGSIEPLPDSINAGIKQRVINGLLSRELITQKGDDYVISAFGLESIGVKALPPETEAPQTKQKEEKKEAPKNLPREGSKLATIVELLNQPKGTTIDAIQTITDWQAHTIRGTLATLKKRFNLTIESTKDEYGHRFYKIIDKQDINIETKKID